MPVKRDREEDEAAAREGFGVESLTGGRNVTIETMMTDMDEMKNKIDEYVTKMAEQTKQMEEHTKQIEEQNHRFTKQAVEMAEKDRLIAQITQGHQLRGKHTTPIKSCFILFHPAPPVVYWLGGMSCLDVCATILHDVWSCISRPPLSTLCVVWQRTTVSGHGNVSLTKHPGRLGLLLPILPRADC
jgi:hypothetical protein